MRPWLACAVTINSLIPWSQVHKTVSYKLVRDSSEFHATSCRIVLYLSSRFYHNPVAIWLSVMALRTSTKLLYPKTPPPFSALRPFSFRPSVSKKLCIPVTSSCVSTWMGDRSQVRLAYTILVFNQLSRPTQSSHPPDGRRKVLVSATAKEETASSA